MSQSQVFLVKYLFLRYPKLSFNILPDRLKVGHRSLKAIILVRFQVWQPSLNMSNINTENNPKLFFTQSKSVWISENFQDIILSKYECT